MKKEKGKIRFLGVTVCYGKTTLQEFISWGFKVSQSKVTLDKKSNTVMCAFRKGRKYYGELVFFDYSKDEVSINDLEDLPLDLVLLNNNIDEDDVSFLRFMEFKGKKWRKDVAILSCFYLFCLILLFVCRRNIPIELFYVTFALPIIFFSFAFLYWNLKRIFSYFYKRLSFLSYVFLCSILFLIWNVIVTFSLIEAKIMSKQSGLDLVMICPIIFFLTVLAFLVFQITWPMHKYFRGKPISMKIICLLINLLIVFVLNQFLSSGSLCQNDNLISYLNILALQLFLFMGFSTIVVFKAIFLN